MVGTDIDGVVGVRRLLIGVTLCLTSCVTAPTLEPHESQQAQTFVPVAVRVLTYQTEQPIAGAIVLRNAVPIGASDQQGLFVFEVVRGTTILLEASKDGYARSVVVEGDVNGSNERWTFFLQPLLTD